MAITESAALSSQGLGVFLEDNLGAESAPFTDMPKLVAHPPPDDHYAASGYAPLSWLQFGSDHEDRTVLRSANHFYKVLSGTPVSGLTDRSESVALPSPIINSFRWASEAGHSEPSTPLIQGYPNIETWINARDYQLSALTTEDKATREEKLALLLFALGHVLHLNQDLSQPDHVRNDNHARKAWIEDYGGKHLSDRPDWFAPRPHGWPYWRDAGFVKLQDFWDRGLYTGQAAALNDDANAAAGKQLGLAEFSNGNFLGEDAGYKELVKAGGKHYFPFPSLVTSTDFNHVKNTIQNNWREYLYPDGTLAKLVYLRKIADGIPVEHHSRLTHLGVVFRKSGGAATFARTTLKNDKVLDDYHSILIPKAIEYSAGILDYFFRGGLEVVSVTWDGTQYILTVRNLSGQELVSGGTFTVWQDDANGNRSAVGSPVNLTQTVADNATWQFNFPGPQVTSPTKYIVVYRGTIGLTSGNASDPVDEEISIAARNFTVDPTEDGPDWSRLFWDTFMEDPASGNGVLTGSAEGPLVQFNLTPGTVGQAALLHGQMTYSGPAAQCRMSVNVTASGPAGQWIGNFSMYVYVDGQQLTGTTVAFFMGPGSYSHVFDFTIPAGTGQLIEAGYAPFCHALNGTMSGSILLELAD